MDVSRRIGNFNRWFVFFAIVFGACYLLANYLMQRQKGEEGKKAEKFFGDFLVLANCTLLLRCITYFYDESLKTPVYHFSSNFVTLVAFAILAYIILDLEKKITTTDFSKLLLIGASVSYSIMIALGWGQESGRLLLGIMTFCLMIILIVIRGKRAIS